MITRISALFVPLTLLCIAGCSSPYVGKWTSGEPATSVLDIRSDRSFTLVFGSSVDEQRVGHWRGGGRRITLEPTRNEQLTPKPFGWHSASARLEQDQLVVDYGWDVTVRYSRQD